MEQVETIVPSAAANGTAALAAVMDNASAVPAYKRNRIQVSNTKKPLFFYVNLAKRYMQQYNEVELSALGMAIATVVTISEILKNNGLAIEKKIQTSTIDMKDENKGRLVQKAKIEILLEKNSADSDGSPKTNTTEEDNTTTTDSLVNATEHSSTAGSNATTTTTPTATEEHTEETKADDKKEEEEFVKEN